MVPTKDMIDELALKLFHQSHFSLFLNVSWDKASKFTKNHFIEVATNMLMQVLELQEVKKVLK